MVLTVNFYFTLVKNKIKCMTLQVYWTMFHRFNLYLDIEN